MCEAQQTQRPVWHKNREANPKKFKKKFFNDKKYEVVKRRSIKAGV
jgi:hypothetical protein